MEYPQQLGLKRQRLLSWCGLSIAALLGAYGLGHQYNISLTQTDCRALWQVISHAIEQHVSPYERGNIEQLAQAAPFTIDELFYPPSFIPLAAPFTLLSEAALRVIILVAQILCFGYILRLSLREVPGHRRALVLLSPVAFFAIFQTARFGQISCFMCVASLLFWDRWRVGRGGVMTVLSLFAATIKPSSLLAVLIFLALEGCFGILIAVASLHLFGFVLASTLTGIDLWSLSWQWYESIAHYRELPQNSPTGNFVYGVSALAYRVFGLQYSLDILALPLAFVVWRSRARLVWNDRIALLLVVSFMVGAPHAYDFLWLLPALLCALHRPHGALLYCIVSVMILLPQRALSAIGLVSFDGALRILAPVVLFLFLMSGRPLAESADANRESM